MAKKASSDNLKAKLNEEIFTKESYLVGLLWGNPELYSYYPVEKLNISHLGNGIWKFYLGLGRHMFDKEIQVFDDIATMEAVNELSLHKKFEDYGGYETMEEIIEALNGQVENFDGYYKEAKKYSMLRSFINLLGEQVLVTNGKYDYKKLNATQIQSYWEDKFSQIAMDSIETTYKEYDLLDGLEEFIDEMNDDPDIGMDYYKSKKLTELTMGWAYGTVSILSAFSGNGKSSFVLEKLVMSCIVHNEKLMVIANEMDRKQYAKLLLVTVMGAELYKKFEEEFKNKGFNRKNLNKGNFTEEEKAKLIEAVKWLREKTKGDNSIIKFIEMEDYTMDNVEKVVRYYARRGYRRLIVDTAKPSEGGKEESRWEQFVSDFDKIYKLSRNGGGGLNLATFATVQSADSALTMRYLNESCLADGRKIKNVVDVVFHIRPVFHDEMYEGSKELKVQRWLPPSDDFNGEGKPVLKEVPLKPRDGVTYYLLFCSKNRRGQTNITGADPIVYGVSFNSNRWAERGTCPNVSRDNFFSK